MAHGAPQAQECRSGVAESPLPTMSHPTLKQTSVCHREGGSRPRALCPQTVVMVILLLLQAHLCLECERCPRGP